MNVLRMELKRTFPSWLAYTVSLAAVLVIFMAFFLSFREDAALLDELLQNFPIEFRTAFGFANVDLSQVNGYLSFLSGYIVLIGAVYGMKLGVSLLSEEPRRKTTDFLLSRPVRREQVFLAKLAAALIGCIAQNLLLVLAGLVSVPLIIGGGGDAGILTLLLLSTLLVQLFFLGIGQVVAVSFQRIKQVMPIALGVVFFFFIVEMVNESLLEKALTYATPFAYFQGSSILARHGYDPVYLLIDLAVFGVATLIAGHIYRTRDLHAV